jgi:hypothetical protein
LTKYLIPKAIPEMMYLVGQGLQVSCLSKCDLKAYCRSVDCTYTDGMMNSRSTAGEIQSASTVKMDVFYFMDGDTSHILWLPFLVAI